MYRPGILGHISPFLRLPDSYQIQSGIHQGHISPFWDYHVLHHFGYSFEVGFRVSPLRHWSVLHSDFLADYCWAEDSWLMMLDSSFGCASYIHTGAYSPFLRDSYLLLYTVRGWMIIVSLFASRLQHPISILGHIPLSITRFIWAVIWGWMIGDDCLPHDFDIGSYTGAHFPHFLWVSLRLGQWLAWF